MRVKRLPPRPTNTPFARWVGRMVKLWPIAFSSTVRTKDRCIKELRSDNRILDMINYTTRRDMREVVGRLALTPHSFSADVSVLKERMAMRTRIEFNPVYIEVNVTPQHWRDYDFSNYTKSMARDCAHELAHSNAEEVAREMERLLADLFRNRLKSMR